MNWIQVLLVIITLGSFMFYFATLQDDSTDGRFLTVKVLLITLANAFFLMATFK